MRTENSILVVSGLAFEAQIALNIGGTKACCGQVPVIADIVASALTTKWSGILSFGLAGGLDPRLRAGSIVIATDIIGKNVHFRTDPEWRAGLLRLFPGAVQSALLSGDRVYVDPDGKLHAFRSSGAAVADMESHVAASYAAEKGIPFAALRIVADPAHRFVPQSALAGVCMDGRIDPLAVLRGLAHRPREALAIAMLACDVWIARAALIKAQRQLGKNLGIPPLGALLSADAKSDLQVRLA